MAAASTTIVRSHELEAGFWVYEVEVDVNDYVANGVAIDAPGNTRFSRIVGLNGKGYVGFFDPAAQKVLVYRQKDPAAAGGADIALVEVANGADLSAVKLYGIATGS